MVNVFDMTKLELEEFLETYNIKKFRASQIFQYIYKQGITDWDDMVLLPKKDREILQEKAPIYFPEVVDRLESSDGRTVKLLLRMVDGNTVESVMLKHDYGNSICVSTQVGCSVKCVFCASAKNGFIRNLTAGEMIVQLLAFKNQVTPELHSLVLMGTGEPLLNYENVIRFLHMIHEKETFYMGYRNITLSTAGIVPRMYDLAEEGIPITLAVSLHAPTTDIRKELMPITNTYPLEEVLMAADNYFVKTGRKVTYEYMLVKNVNCSIPCAEMLTRIMKGKNILINIIPINDNYDVGLRKPSQMEINRFFSYLQKQGLNVTLRKEMGSQIQAACGQLRIKREDF
jgi:23S rRNA (adenine2503-C2)-methyltransferase